MCLGGGRLRAGRRSSRTRDLERRSHASRWLVLYSFPRAGGAGDADAEPRLGVSVGRKVGGAVERNRVKRVLREALVDGPDEEQVAVETRVHTAEAAAGAYRAVVQVSEVDGRRYVDKGWRV